MELEPNRKLFPDHLPSILHGTVLVGAGSLWPFTITYYIQNRVLIVLSLKYKHEQMNGIRCETILNITTGVKLIILLLADKKKPHYF
jgi:hypothetical protein